MDLVLSNFELVVARGEGPVAPAETRTLRRTRHVTSDDEDEDQTANINPNSCQSSAKVAPTPPHIRIPAYPHTRMPPCPRAPGPGPLGPPAAWRNGRVVQSVSECERIEASHDSPCPLTLRGAQMITIESKERKDYLTGTLDKHPSLRQALSDSSTLILYPGPGAVDIERCPARVLCSCA